MSKPVRILQPIPREGQRFVVAPYGLFLNRELQTAKPGSEIEFWQEWRHKKFRIVQIAKMRINTPEFTFIMRHAHGQRFRIVDLMNRFDRWSNDAGAGSSGYETESCIVIELSAYEETE